MTISLTDRQRHGFGGVGGSGGFGFGFGGVRIYYCILYDFLFRVYIYDNKYIIVI